MTCAKVFLLTVFLLGTALNAHARIRTETIEYKTGIPYWKDISHMTIPSKEKYREYLSCTNGPVSGLTYRGAPGR